MADGGEAGDRRAVARPRREEAARDRRRGRPPRRRARVPALAGGPLDREVDVGARRRADPGLGGHAAQYQRAGRSGPVAPAQPRRLDAAAPARRCLGHNPGSRPQPPMEEQQAMTRRDAIRGAAGLAVLGAARRRAPGAGRAADGRGRTRVAVIGAGAGGVAAAYFLAGTHDVDVFEARSRIGGHCDSRTIDYKGHPRHGRSRRAVLPSRHPPALRHASRGARPLRPREPHVAPDARVAGQPVRVPNDRRRPAAVHVDPSARHAAQRARVRLLHAARAAGGPRRAGLGDHRR